MRSLIFVLAAVLTPLVVGADNAPSKPQHQTYSHNEIVRAVEGFFGEGALGLAEVLEKACADYGEPNAYIAGDEVSAALGFGVRYGKGLLQTKSGERREIHWRGPSIGFDAGANASKIFILVYRLDDVLDLFQLYPGIEGSLFFAGGVGMNYLQSGDTVLAPIRLGAGWRQGVNVGYMDFTREASVVPL